MRGKKPNSLTILKNVRPGGGRARHVHALTPLLAAPERLTAEEREVFENIRENAPHGLLGQIDTFLLEALAVHTVLHRRCVREVDTLVFESHSTRRAHPLIAAADAQVKALIALSESLGLTAPVRQRLKLPQAVSDDWADVGGA